jgi:ABC-2 type transport system ATP-binding protein
VALIGPNGAGKSTTLKALVGLVRPDGGELLVDGIDLRGDPIAGRARIGYLPQEVVFEQTLCGREVLELIARLRRRPRGEVTRVLDLVGLRDAADRPVGGYSGGMRQRLGLAAAFLGSPPALVLDEPAISLDPLFHLELRRLLSSAREAGAAVLLTSHLLPEVEALADRIALCSAGRLLAQGTMEELASLRGLARATRLHVPGANGTVPELAARAGARVLSYDAGWLTVAGSGSVRAEVFRALEAAGVRVEGVEALPLTLADVFRAWYGAPEDA